MLILAHTIELDEDVVEHLLAIAADVGSVQIQRTGELDDPIRHIRWVVLSEEQCFTGRWRWQLVRFLEQLLLVHQLFE